MLFVPAVIYQLELISSGLWAGYNTIMKGDYIGGLRHFLTWDFSQ